jgi:hypothetical protein
MAGEGRGETERIGKTAMVLTNTNATRDYQQAYQPTEGVLQQTTPMAYVTQTKTSRRKSLSQKHFGSFQTHPARPSMQKALQNLGAKIALSASYSSRSA